MVKSYEYESEVLKQLGYGSSSAATIDRPTRSDRSSNENPMGTCTESATSIKMSVSGCCPVPRSRSSGKCGSPTELLTAVRMSAIFGAVCAVLTVCITAHMRTVANDRQIQSLNIQIANAQAEHEALTNALAVKSSQVAIATRARHLGMLQNPAEMTIALSYGQGKTSFGPQIADAE